jgi:hypothetical protein
MATYAACVLAVTHPPDAKRCRFARSLANCDRPGEQRVPVYYRRGRVVS